jgi:hypothetical protein
MRRLRGTCEEGFILMELLVVVLSTERVAGQRRCWAQGSIGSHYSHPDPPPSPFKLFGSPGGTRIGPLTCSQLISPPAPIAAGLVPLGVGVSL